MNLSYKYKSPLNFLRPFEKDDEIIFFGRDREIEEVFKQFKKTNLVVIYGPSGSGKSSVALCGLTNRFFEWESFIIRRNENFVDSFFEKIKDIITIDQDIKIQFNKYYNSIIKIDALKKKLLIINRDKRNKNVTKSDISDSNSQLKTIKEELTIYEEERFNSLKLIDQFIDELYYELSFAPFFIFDQFEELFISGNKDERNKFSVLLSLITQETKQTNVVICIQTDFLGNLFELEKYNPNIVHHKCRVDDPTDDNVREILKGNFSHFNINQDLPESVQNDRINDIITIQKRSGKIHLPFLQIYLNKLYIEDFLRDYPNESHLLEPHEKKGDFKKKNSKLDFSKYPLTFEESEIKSYGEIDEILTNYISDINDALVLKANDIAKKGYEDTVKIFLRKFITDKDTRKTIKYELIERDDGNAYFKIVDPLIHSQITKSIWKDEGLSHNESISDIIEELISARILRRRDNQFLEISHNLLVKIIKGFIVENDVIEYYKAQFNSAYEAFEQQTKGQQIKPRTIVKNKLLGRKKVNRVYYFSKELMDTIGGIDNIVNEEDPKINEKINYWEASEFYHKANRIILTITFAIVIGVITLLSIGFLGYSYKLKAGEEQTLKLLDSIKNEKEVDEDRIRLSIDISNAIGNTKNNKTSTYKELKRISKIINDHPSLDHNDFILGFETIEQLERDTIRKPFYLNEIGPPIDRDSLLILSVKSRPIPGSDKNLLLLANTKEDLFSCEVEIGNSIVNNTWKPSRVGNEGHLADSNVSAFEPYERSIEYRVNSNKELRVLYSNKDGLFDRDASFKNPISWLDNDKLKNLKSIEFIADQEKEGINKDYGIAFVALDKNEKMLHRVRVKRIDKSITSRVIPLEDLANQLKQYDTTLLKNLDDPTLRFKFIKKSGDYDICFLVEVNDSTSFLVNRNIWPKDENIKLYNLRNLDKFTGLDSITNMHINEKEKLVLLSTNKFVYSLRLDKLKNPTQKSEADTAIKLQPIIVPHNQKKINSISNLDKYIIIGSDHITAGVYSKQFGDGRFGYLNMELDGHGESFDNVTLFNLDEPNQKSIYALTFGRHDNTIKIWDLSAIDEGESKEMNAQYIK